MISGAQLALGRIPGRDGIEHLDIGRSCEVLADRAEAVVVDGTSGALTALDALRAEAEALLHVDSAQLCPVFSCSDCFCSTGGYAKERS